MVPHRGGRHGRDDRSGRRADDRFHRSRGADRGPQLAQEEAGPARDHPRVEGNPGAAEDHAPRSPLRHQGVVVSRP